MTMRPRGGVVTRRIANPFTAGSSPAQGLQHYREDRKRLCNAFDSNQTGISEIQSIREGVRRSGGLPIATALIFTTAACAGWLGVSNRGATFSVTAVVRWAGTLGRLAY